MTAIGRKDLADDPQLADNMGRVARVDELDAAISAFTATCSVDEALAVLERASVPSGKIYTIADIAQDPHYAARGMLQPLQMPDGSEMLVPGIVPRLSGSPGGQHRLAPDLGQDTDVVLAEIGLSTEQIRALKDRGIIAGG